MSPERVMLVVLPFEELSRDPGQEYLSDGLTDETIGILGRLASDRLGFIARGKVNLLVKTPVTTPRAYGDLGIPATVSYRQIPPPIAIGVPRIQ